MRICNLHTRTQSASSATGTPACALTTKNHKPQPETAIGSLQLSYPATFPYATAISAATRALFKSNATFAPSVLPPLPFDNASNK